MPRGGGRVEFAFLAGKNGVRRASTSNVLPICSRQGAALHAAEGSSRKLNRFNHAPCFRHPAAELSGNFRLLSTAFQRDDRGMKAIPVLCFGLFLLGSILTVSARDAALRYKFTAGQTNVFAVEITVRGETGSEVSTGNVFLVTREVTTNSATLVCRGNLRAEIKRTPSRGPGMFGGYYPSGMMQNQNVFPNDCEITLDFQGNEIRDGGDYVLAAPLGKLVQSLYAPLPAKSGGDEFTDATSVLDDPLWLGPADNFMNVSLNGQPMRMRSYMGGYPQPGLATLLVRRQVTSRAVSATESLAWHRQSRFESLLKTGNDPRFSATSESDLTFDKNLGMFTRIETQADVNSQTETSSRKARAIFKARLLTDAELAVALAPPPPPALPRKLTAADLEKIQTDLQSSDLEVRRSAIRQLNGVEVPTPSAELIEAVAAVALDSDSFTRMTAATFLGTYATTNQVPVLLKLLKDSDWSSRQPPVKALGRLKDERAIQPLADLVARGGNMYGQDASAALINIGAPAEKAALGLLNERNADTQRQACTILQSIGTSASLEPLQKLIGDSDQQVNQAAMEAIRAIKQRQ
jgi:hypothetical protein